MGKNHLKVLGQIKIHTMGRGQQATTAGSRASHHSNHPMGQKPMGKNHQTIRVGNQLPQKRKTVVRLNLKHKLLLPAKIIVGETASRHSCQFPNRTIHQQPRQSNSQLTRSKTPRNPNAKQPNYQLLNLRLTPLVGGITYLVNWRRKA